MTENCRNFHFFKGVNPWIWSKILKFSLSLFFLKIGLDKLYEYIRHRKQGFVDYKNDIRAKSKNCHFFKGVNPLFWTKFEIPSHFVLSLKFSQIYSLVFFQIENTALQTIKMTLNQSLKIDILPKGLTHCVNDIQKSPKICIFSNGCFRGLYFHKNDIRAKSKNCHFPKGLTHSFSQKFEISLSLYFFTMT